MVEILEITGEDIKKLRDDDLRTLIGRLCEADYRAAKQRTSGITWGGNQDAADGGLDVVIRDDIQPPTSSNIPRAKTGFQVKVPAMSVTQIITEMKPKGLLRESIKTLIRDKGAYIIVSSTSSSSDSAIKNRRNAMRAAVSDIAGHEDLFLDFYDCGRIATWVRNHPLLILWIREKIGQPLNGWQPYGNWSHSPKGIQDSYLSEGVRFFGERDEEINAIDTIHDLRNKLSQTKSFIRLVGLSGVGKTRFVQTLFDKCIGENYLDPSTVIYTDMSDSPSPEPVALANRLIAERLSAIMIIDNCPPDLHRRLVQVFVSDESTVSLLTIEYDVKDDLPEETEVLRLEPTSDELIQQLIERRFNHISGVNIRSIAEFSGGNARVAIALARTIKSDETIGRLRDKGLFKRLFDQTDDYNEVLLHCAEGLALVYSFEGTDIESENSELAVIANIIGCKVEKLYRSVAELKQRQLIQSRGQWRAVLPHAIANRLAEYALKAIPKQKILNSFMQVANERLLRSFTHRLSFLHDNVEAKEIVSEWLKPEGWLGKANGNLNKLGFDVLQNIAPVVPDMLLSLIEHWSKNDDFFSSIGKVYHQERDYVYILWHIAYDPTLFSRSVKILCQFALLKASSEKRNQSKDTLKSLFYLYLSGTHASTTERRQFLDDFWLNGNEEEQDLALILLDGTYETRHFTSFHDFSFGARPRDSGWQPKTPNEVVHWYKTFITLGVEFAQSSSKKADDAKKLLANNFYGMWTKGGLYDELEQMCDSILKTGGWHEGWIAVRRTRLFQLQDNNLDAIGQLQRIENKLKPSNLLEMVRAYTLTDHNFSCDLVDIEEEEDNGIILGRHDKAERIAESLGQKVGEEKEVLTSLLPEILRTNNGQIWSFGKGIGNSSFDKKELWANVRLAYGDVPSNEMRVQFVVGLLSSDSMDYLRDAILDSLVEDSIFREHFPLIQASLTINPEALSRLCRSLDLGIAPIKSYQYIGWGRAHEALNDHDLISYLRKIMLRYGGVLVAFEIISVRLESRSVIKSDIVVEFARDILLNLSYTKELLDQTFHRSDYTLAKVTAECMEGPGAKQAAYDLCSIMYKGISENRIHVGDFARFLGNLAKLQSIIFLDIFMPTDGTRLNFDNPFSSHSLGNGILRNISNSDIISWCQLGSETRFLTIASSIELFIYIQEQKASDWNPLVYDLLNSAPNTLAILEEFSKYIIPNVWTGSRADILIERGKVIQKLFVHDNKIIVGWAKEKYSFIIERARKEKLGEDFRDREYNKAHSETFE